MVVLVGWRLDVEDSLDAAQVTQLGRQKAGAARDKKVCSPSHPWTTPVNLRFKIADRVFMPRPSRIERNEIVCIAA